MASLQNLDWTSQISVSSLYNKSIHWNVQCTKILVSTAIRDFQEKESVGEFRSKTKSQKDPSGKVLKYNKDCVKWHTVGTKLDSVWLLPSNSTAIFISGPFLCHFPTDRSQGQMLFLQHDSFKWNSQMYWFEIRRATQGHRLHRAADLNSFGPATVS